MALTKAWASYFRSSVRMRGRQYQTQGRVHQQPPQAGELIRASVTGSRDYTVVIRDDGASTSATCTCPLFSSGQYCKHIWATLVEVEKNGLLAERTALGAARGIEAGPPQPPKARKRDPNETRHRPSHEPQWMGRLSLLRYAATETPEVPGSVPGPVATVTPRQVCYIVNVDLSLAAHRLVIDLNQRQMTRAGWGALKPLKLTPDQIPTLTDPQDRELCALILGGRSWQDMDRLESPRPQETYVLAPGARRTLLKRLIATDRCFIQGDEVERSDDPDRLAPLRWDTDEPWVLWLACADEGEDFRFFLQLRRAEATLPITRPRLLLSGPDGLVFYGNHAAPYEEREAAHWAEHFRTGLQLESTAEGLRVPVADLERFLDRLYLMSNLPEIDLPPGLGRLEKHLTPVPHLELYSPNSPALANVITAGLPRHLLIARLWFAYGDQRITPGTPGRFVVIEGQAAAANGRAQEEGTAADPLTPGPWPLAPTGELIRRDLRAEAEALALAVSLGFRPDPGAAGAQALGGVLPLRLMSSTVYLLSTRGWVLTADRALVRTAARPSFAITSGVDWFELRGGLKFTRGDGTEELVGLPAVLAAAREGRHMVTLADGSQGLLPEDWLRQHGLLAAIGTVEGDHLRFKSSQTALVDALLAHQEAVEVDEPFAHARQRLQRFTGVQPLEAGPGFQGLLRPYQREGLGWFDFLREFGMGGILADDMGLGKTVQVLAMLAQKEDAGGKDQNPDRKESQPSPGLALQDNAERPAERPAEQPETPLAPCPLPLAPALVVAPRSVVFNWLDEAHRFTPGLKVHAYTGSERQAQREAFEQYDLIVTTYGLMRRDIEELTKQTFSYVILDEAQAIKNPASQVAKAARLLTARHRLALTGTPVENHLGDLWSIFEFLNPGILGGAGGFARLVRGSIQESRAATTGPGDNGSANGHGNNGPSDAGPGAPDAL